MDYYLWRWLTNIWQLSTGCQFNIQLRNLRTSSLKCIVSQRINTEFQHIESVNCHSLNSWAWKLAIYFFSCSVGQSSLRTHSDSVVGTDPTTNGKMLVICIWIIHGWEPNEFSHQSDFKQKSFVLWDVRCLISRKKYCSLYFLVWVIESSHWQCHWWSFPPTSLVILRALGRHFKAGSCRHNRQ